MGPGTNPCWTPEIGNNRFVELKLQHLLGGSFFSVQYLLRGFSYQKKIQNLISPVDYGDLFFTYRHLAYSTAKAEGRVKD